MLIPDNMEENEMLIELGLTKKSEEINKKKYSTEQANKGNNDQEYSMNNVTLERLNEMINKILVEEKYEVWEINQRCEEIFIKLSLNYNDQLENCNRMLGKRMMNLDEINDECYRYIGELNQEVSRLETESLEKERRDTKGV